MIDVKKKKAIMEICSVSSSGESMLTLTRFAPAGAGIFETDEGSYDLFVLSSFGQFLSGACEVRNEVQNVTLGFELHYHKAALSRA